MQDALIKQLEAAASTLGIIDVPVLVERPADVAHGDYTSNVALIAAKKLGKNPRELAEEIVESIKHHELRIKGEIEKIEVAGAGFINFYLSTDFLLRELQKVLENEDFVPADRLEGKKIMVEYAHPNTHKEMHIGHMRTLITGEAIARLLEAQGATVFRANYQGDIGPHVAKAIYGLIEFAKEENKSIDDFISEVAGWSSKDKAHLLGRAYARGSKDYEATTSAVNKITRINELLYIKKLNIGTTNVDNSQEFTAEIDQTYDLYIKTRQWSLDYYQDFYTRFYTEFDKLFFESEVAESGKSIVLQNVGKVFEKSDDTIIFPGEKYGVHTRVFITKLGYPTYEGKEMGNGFAEAQAFPFDLKVHVVASEQAGYFQVVFKALELIDSDTFKNKQHHVSMGMVTLTDRKMSSRTGDVLTVDWLLDEVKKRVLALSSDDRVSEGDRERVAEEVTIAAVKHSVLRVGTTQNVAFSIEKSVSLEGDSGPYLQYTYVRTQSVLEKGQAKDKTFENLLENDKLQAEELALLRQLARFDEAVMLAAERYNPSVLAGYLFELSQEFNLFYQKLPILKEEGKTREFRLALTAAVGKRIKHGLSLLGIRTPEKM